MNALTNKYQSNQILRLTLLTSLFAFLVLLFAPTPAEAASKVYALSCPGKDNGVVIKDNKLDCKKQPPSIYVQGIGSKEQAAKNGRAYPDDVELTLVVVNCNGSSVKDPKLGSRITKFSCSKSSVSPTIRKQNVSPNPIPVKKNPTTSSYSTTQSGTTTGGRDVSGSQKTGCEGNKCKDPAANPDKECNQDNGCDIIAKYVNPTIRLLTYVFAIIAVISIIMGGIQYAASTGDPQKVTAAKKRIGNTIIAIVAYFFLYGFLQFLIPGGAFNR